MAWTVPFLIVAVAIGPLVAKEIAERPSYNNVDDLPSNNNELVLEDEADWGLAAERGNSGTCADVGGKCMPKKSASKKCKGKIEERFVCPSSKLVCCIDGCPEDQGFFRLPHPSNQCFKLFLNPCNWVTANKTCHDAGLVLAKPLETIALKNYLTLRYGDLSNSKVKIGMPVTAWLDAVADGSCMKWNRGPYGCISPALPIWWPGQPIVAKGRCLLLTSNFNDWKNNPDKSLYALPCHINDRLPLCELLM